MDALVYFTVAVLIAIWWCRHLEHFYRSGEANPTDHKVAEVRHFVIRISE